MLNAPLLMNGVYLLSSLVILFGRSFCDFLFASHGDDKEE